MIEQFLGGMRRRGKKNEGSPVPPSSEEVEALRLALSESVAQHLKEQYATTPSSIAISISALGNELEVTITLDPDTSDATLSGFASYMAGGGSSLSIGEMGAIGNLEDIQKVEHIQAKIEADLQAMKLTTNRMTFGWYAPEQIKALPKGEISVEDTNQAIAVKFLLGWRVSKVTLKQV